MANMSTVGNGTGAYSGRIPLNVTLHAWPIPKFDPNLKQSNETNPVIHKNIESAKNYTSSLHNLNATGYVAIDDDLTDTGFTDVQTFILAGIATVIPLLIIVATILGIRYLWRKFTARKGDGYEGVLQKEESSEPLGKLQSYSIPQELKTSESQFTVTPGEDMTNALTPQLLTSKSNGSVITMTLKNNHLIVETEETTNPTTGIKIESKGTTTKFVTTKAGSFRSEIDSEAATNYNKNQPAQLTQGESSEKILPSTDPGILVHCAQDEMEDELDKGSCNTGLSQSDLSVSSTESQNPSYRYGNQIGYDSGGYGYPEYSGYSFSERRPQPKEPDSNSRRNWSFSAKESVDYDLPGNQPAGPPLKDILMSDIQAREIREEKNYQEDQKKLATNDPAVTETSLENNSLLSKSTANTKEAQTAQLRTETSQLGNENAVEKIHQAQFGKSNHVHCY